MTNEAQLDFTASAACSLGVELELMLIDKENGMLVSAAEPILSDLASRSRAERIKAEITQSMIEINSSIHTDLDALEQDLRQQCEWINESADAQGVHVCGGGAHPFREWHEREIYPQTRFEKLSQRFGYLAKQFTVFGQHVHVGVPSADAAIRLTHVLNHYVPHFIALSAASPFQRGVDTSFQSSRVNVVNMFPMSGHMPPFADWREFCAYYERMRRSGVIESIKDFYWDVRPKPEFGTVELRVCDTPLTVSHAVDLAALVQSLAHEVLTNNEVWPRELQYETYASNRYRAARFGLDAVILDTRTGAAISLQADTIQVLDEAIRRNDSPSATRRLLRLRSRCDQGANDAQWLRCKVEQGCDWPTLLQAQAHLLLSPRAAPVFDAISS